MKRFRDTIPEDWREAILEDAIVAVQYDKTPAIAMERWRETMSAASTRSKADVAKVIRGVCKGIEDDPEGALVFFTNVWRFVHEGRKPSRWFGD